MGWNVSLGKESVAVGQVFERRIGDESEQSMEINIINIHSVVESQKINTTSPLPLQKQHH